MRGMESRIDRLEDRLVIGEERQRWLRDMTIAANMQKVQPSVLYELILATLENALFPGEPSLRPDFVDKELLSPASDDEIRLAEEQERRRVELPEEPPLTEIIRIMDSAAEMARGHIENVSFLPVGYNHPRWDMRAFVNRWERVRKELLSVDRENGGTN